jgi:hypothetical protein
MFKAPPPDKRAVYEIMWKNTEGSERQQMIIWRTSTSPWVPKAYCFSTATMVAQMRLNVTLYLHCQYCLCELGSY